MKFLDKENIPPVRMGKANSIQTIPIASKVRYSDKENKNSMIGKQKKRDSKRILRKDGNESESDDNNEKMSSNSVKRSKNENENSNQNC
jgi:hypothetical protein